MSTLKAKAQSILSEKNAKVKTQNIKKDVTIFGVTGTLEAAPDYITDDYGIIENMKILKQSWFEIGGDTPAGSANFKISSLYSTDGISTIFDCILYNNNGRFDIYDMNFNFTFYDSSDNVVGTASVYYDSTMRLSAGDFGYISHIKVNNSFFVYTADRFEVTYGGH